MGSHIKTSGPVFDGRATAALKDFMEDTEKTVAEEGERMIVSTLGHVLRHPTGYYVSRVHTEQTASAYQVNDSSVVYGNWLEGTSSRNRTTRFKGYHHWRLTAQKLQQKAPHIAQRLLGRYLRRMQ